MESQQFKTTLRKIHLLFLDLDRGRNCLHFVESDSFVIDVFRVIVSEKSKVHGKFKKNSPFTFGFGERKELLTFS